MNMNCGKVRMVNWNSSCCRPLQGDLNLHRERERERCIKQLIYSSMISNVELQLYIYRRLTLIFLAHVTQDNWLVNSACAL